MDTSIVDQPDRLTVELPTKVDESSKRAMHVSRLKLEIRREYQQNRRYESALVTIAQLEKVIKSQEDTIQALRQQKPSSSVQILKRVVKVPSEVVRQKVITVERIIQKVKYIPIGYEWKQIQKHESKSTQVTADPQISQIEMMASRPTQKFETLKVDQMRLVEEIDSLKEELSRKSELIRQLEEAYAESVRQLEEKKSGKEDITSLIKQPTQQKKKSPVKKKTVTQKGYSEVQLKQKQAQQQQLQRRMTLILGNSRVESDKSESPLVLLDKITQRMSKMALQKDDQASGLKHRIEKMEQLLNESAQYFPPEYAKCLEETLDQIRGRATTSQIEGPTLNFGKARRDNDDSEQHAIKENKQFIHVEQLQQIKQNNDKQRRAAEVVIRKLMGRHDCLLAENKELKKRLQEEKPPQQKNLGLLLQDELDRLRKEVRQKDETIYHLRGIVKGAAKPAGTQQLQKQLVRKIGECDKLKLKVCKLEETLGGLKQKSGTDDRGEPEQTLKRANEELKDKVCSLQGFARSMQQEGIEDKRLVEAQKAILRELQVRLREEKRGHAQARSKLVQLQSLLDQTEQSVSTMVSQQLQKSQGSAEQHQLLFQLFKLLAYRKQVRRKVMGGPLGLATVKTLLAELDSGIDQQVVLAALIQQSPLALVQILRQTRKELKRVLAELQYLQASMTAQQQKKAKEEGRDQLLRDLKDMQGYVQFMHREADSKDKVIRKLVYDPSGKSNARVQVEEPGIAHGSAAHLRGTSVKFIGEVPDSTGKLVRVSNHQLRMKIDRMENSLWQINNRVHRQLQERHRAEECLKRFKVPSSQRLEQNPNDPFQRLRQQLLSGQLRTTLEELRQALIAKQEDRSRRLVQALVQQAHDVLQPNEVGSESQPQSNRYLARRNSGEMSSDREQ